MLTGIIKPTKGDALIYGKSLRYELPEIQGMLGVCPQVGIFQEFSIDFSSMIFYGLN
jgi:ATP-binding cassette subfamily A (ABC1) protein 3